MLQKTELTLLYDTILSIPGMNEPVKLGLQTSRKSLLFLSQVIERGLAGPEDQPAHSVLDVASLEIRQELLDLSEDLLKKGGLSEMYQKLKAL